MAQQVADAPIAEQIAKVAKLIEGIDIAMMTTVDESGELHSRPMSTQQADFDGTVWFFAFSDSAVADDIRRDARVNLGYAKQNDQTYLSLAGRAEVSFDRAKMEELYSPMLEAWFPQGLETPGIALIKVEAASAHYWDSPASGVAQLIGLVKAKATGQGQP
ncbi:MAG: pyridoxamine 5'-phosphate oxidase family protein, partial [Chloroflexia bacterium]|nr:pyridoxamine 5'-phosphate oxidase family protein [Chloroflexia bacterium]